jgi:hypothetical protein
MKKLGFTLLSAASVAWLATACQPAGPGQESNHAEADGRAGPAGDKGEAGRGPIKRVNAVVDFSKADTIADQVQDLASGLDGASLVHLDLTIVPAGEEAADYRVTETPPSGATRPLACESGQRLESRSFGFVFNPDYNHLLLDILHGPPAAAPYSTAACAVRGGSAVPVFTIRGYYSVSAVSIPTASDLQLRPVSPAFHD